MFLVLPKIRYMRDFVIKAYVSKLDNIKEFVSTKIMCKRIFSIVRFLINLQNNISKNSMLFLILKMLMKNIY